MEQGDRVDREPGDEGRWCAVGASSDPSAQRAGSEATRVALAGGKSPALTVVFASDAYDLPVLVETISSESGGAPMVGCSTAGEIATNGPGDSGVVVMALGGPGFVVRTGSATATGANLRDASAKAATCCHELGPQPHRVLLLLSDGLAGDQQEIVRGAYRTVGAEVPLVGGCAGDDLKMKRTYQFHDGKVLENSVVAAALGSPSPMGIGVRHGWRRLGEPMLVTGSEGNRVHTMDDEPALDVYLRRLNAPPEASADPEAFTRFAMTHPLGLSRRSGEEVRFVAEANFEDRSLGCVAQVPQGGLAWFMEGDDDSVLAATDAACGDAMAALDGRPPVGLLAFDCIARRGVLGDEGTVREVERISKFADGAPVAGFYTYGEIARTHGTTGFHNQTLVVLAVS